MIMSKEHFERVNPRRRGWLVAVAGKSEKQPNIPDENNPYVPGSPEWKEWLVGRNYGAQFKKKYGSDNLFWCS